MNDEIDVIESGENDLESGNQDYIAAIRAIKENSVPVKDYKKLQEEHRILLDAYVNGREIDIPDEENVDIDQLRKDLFGEGSDLNNLEYVEKALKLRKALMEKGERDPFLPIGDRVQETAEMHEKAANVAAFLQDCVNAADGDSGIFTAQLQRGMKDPVIQRKRGK